MQIDLARQYLELAKIHYPGKAALRHHVFKFLEQWAPSDVEIRTAMLVCNMEPDDYMKCVDMVEARYPVRIHVPLIVRNTIFACWSAVGSHICDLLLCESLVWWLRVLDVVYRYLFFM